MSEDKDKNLKVLCDDPEKGGGVMVDLDVVDYILNALESMSVPLDKDPLSGGPTRLQGKIATSRNLLTKVQRWYHIVSRADHSLSRSLLLVSTELELKQTDLLANDPEVTQGTRSSYKDREAVAHYKLRDLFSDKFRLETAVHDTKAVLRALSQKRTDLKDTVSRLRDQMRLCQDELTLGMHWGSRVPDSAPRIPPRVYTQPSPPSPSSGDMSDDDYFAGAFLDDVLEGVEDTQESSIRLNCTDPMPASVPKDPFPGAVEEEEEEESAAEEEESAVEQADSALDVLDIGVLNSILQATQDIPSTVEPAPAVGDGLPDDFWD